MLTINIDALSREQFLQLREAKRLIKEEFSTSISIADEKILDQIYSYALESENEKLFDVFESLTGSNSPKSTQPVVMPNSGIIQQEKKTRGLFSRNKKYQIGDIFDGKKIVKIYRGAPVFEGE